MAAALFGVARAEIDDGRIKDGPVAEGLLDAPFAEEEVIVLSAGLLESGRPVTGEVVAALAPYGLDMTAHRSTQLTAAAVEQADLVIAMERRHGREAVLLVPSAFGRTFTLKELVRRGEQAGPRVPDQPLAAWLEQLAEGRQRTDLVGRSVEDDVVDPIGGSLANYRATAAEIADLTRRMARLLWLDAEPADS
jgi:protein-tyrosine-phosphatase